MPKKKRQKKEKDVFTEKEKLEICRAIKNLLKIIQNSSAKATERLHEDNGFFLVTKYSTISDTLNLIRLLELEDLEKLRDKGYIDQKTHDALKNDFLINPFKIEPNNPTLRTWKSLKE